MKAVRIHAPADPKQLVYEDISKPSPKIGEALIQVRAVGITPSELLWSSYAEEHLPMVIGHDFSGIIEAVGAEVDQVKIGDSVYGLADFWRDGAAAEYVVVKASDLAHKPVSLSHIQAAAVPTSALTGWQAIFDHAGLVSGQRILIHGAAGGVGSFAIQFAHWKGAYVIGTVSSRDLNFVRGLGADEIIDYRAQRFEEMVKDVDAVLDTVGGETLERSWKTLRHKGILVSCAGIPSEADAKEHHARGVFFIVQSNRAQLTEIGALIDSGVVRPIISTVIPLERAREAFELGQSGRGKIVLTVAAEDSPS